MKAFKAFFKYPQLNKIYILPSRYGLSFGIAIFLIFMVATVYGNNLAYLLAFTIFTFLFISMMSTHFHLMNVKIIPLQVKNCFEGENVLVHFIIKNEGLTSKWSLQVDLEGDFSSTNYFLGPQEAMNGQLSFLGQKRGNYQLTKIRLSTSYPLGLFCSWKWLSFCHSYWIYPRPFHERECLRHDSGESKGETASKTSNQGREGDEFHHHRPYQEGESLRNLDWKALARGAGRKVKVYQSWPQKRLIFSWKDLEQLPYEKRIGQLVSWILSAEKKGQEYRLDLPKELQERGKDYLEGRQPESCLRMLALFPADSLDDPLATPKVEQEGPGWK